MLAPMHLTPPCGSSSNYDPRHPPPPSSSLLLSQGSVRHPVRHVQGVGVAAPGQPVGEIPRGDTAGARRHRHCQAVTRCGCVWVGVCAYMCVCMFLCVCVCMYVCLYTSVCKCVCAQQASSICACLVAVSVISPLILPMLIVFHCACMSACSPYTLPSPLRHPPYLPPSPPTAASHTFIFVLVILVSSRLSPPFRPTYGVRSTLQERCGQRSH